MRNDNLLKVTGSSFFHSLQKSQAYDTGVLSLDPEKIYEHFIHFGHHISFFHVKGKAADVLLNYTQQIMSYMITIRRI